MYKRMVMASAMLLALIVAPLMIAPKTAQATWSGDNCHLVVNNYPVFGGPMNVNGCMRWNFDPGNQYGVYAYMYVPQSYELYTRAEGYDVCGQGAFTVPRMSNATYAYNNTYNITLLAVGVYANCVNGHDYQVCGAGSRKWTVVSAWQYAAGCWINP